MIRKSPVNEDFWELWRESKDELKQSGISVSKFRDEWSVTWWADEDGKFSAPSDAPEKPEVQISLEPLRYPPSTQWAFQTTSIQLGVRSMKVHGRCLLGHSTGCGKTFIALAIAKELGMDVFVVCPKGIATDWKRACQAMGVEFVGVHGWEWVKTGKTGNGKFVQYTVGKSKKAHHRFVWDLPKNCILIFDETHRAKGVGTKNSLLVQAAAEKNIPSLGLSATIASNPMHLSAVGYWLKLHEGGGSFFSWAMRHGVRKTRFGFQFQGGERDLRKIHEVIFPDIGNRLRVSDLGNAFPENQVIATAYDMDSAKEIGRAYRDLESRIEEIKTYEDKAAAQAHILAEITRARQRIELLKAPAIIEMVEDQIEEGNSVFIAVNFRETLEFLSSKIDCYSIQGGQTERERRGAIDSFQRDEKHCIVGIIQACREGLNLHDINGTRPRSSYIMPCQSVFDLKQVLGRIHRAGGQSKVIQRIVYAAGVGVEEDICNSLNAKLRNMDTLNDGEIDPSINLSTQTA